MSSVTAADDVALFSVGPSNFASVTGGDSAGAGALAGFSSVGWFVTVQTRTCTTMPDRSIEGRVVNRLRNDELTG